MANKLNNRVISLLVKLNNLLIKIMKLRTNNRASGLLADALAINKELLALFDKEKVDYIFVKGVFIIILEFVKEVVGKWLRCELTPFQAILYKICYQPAN